MAKLYNLARMTTATTGTGTITLGSAVTSYLSFASSGVSDGETVTYAIVDGNNREIGRGVYTASGTTLTRTVLESTNSNNPINLSGNAEVFITAAAEDIANVNETNTFTASQIINVGSSDTALRVTQTAGGNAILVEDSSNPDSTPFVVTAEGRVGIGEDIPSFYLQVAAPDASTQVQMGLTSTNYASDFKAVYFGYSDSSATGTTYGISNAGLGSVRFQNTSNALIGTNGGTPLIFATTATERMRITSGGNVGIGLTNPSVQLQVVGSASQNRFWLGSAATTNRQLFVRSNGTLAVPTIVASGDAVGSTNFFGYDGAANIELANITATVDGTPGTNDMPGRLTFSTTADGAASPTERFRIGNAGQLGIGGANYGTSGQFIKSAGSAAAPSWASITNTDVSGLGTMSTQDANNVSITGGSISGITDLAVADGGTGASSFTAYSVVLGGTTGTGALQNVSGLGTSGQVLTSNGTGAIPSWQSVAAGSTMEYIAHGVQSGTSAVSFTSIPSGYATLYLYVQGHYASGGTHRVALSSNNGSSYGTVRNFTAAVGASGVGGGWVAISNVSASGSNKVVTPSFSYVERLENTTNRTVATYTTTATENVVTGLINALRVTCDSSGNSSSITLYGVK